ncbi:MAG: ATP-dependent DNA helicase PcrA [Phycisphaerae bacterium]|nr:ATP-dependent DNA helicase PcrA [Phycisphaerae bacterium]
MQTHDDLLVGLNPPQQEAVKQTAGPLLVLAGAGSGKTRVITRRAAYLAATTTSPRHILCITFTNKAAGEMQERVAALGIGREMLVCTFHSLCARLLRWYAVEAGLSADFTIIDEDEKRQLLKQAIQQAELSSEHWTPARVDARISDAKNRLITPESFADEPGESSFVQRTLARIYRHYQDLLQQQQVVDFDELLMRTALLLGQNQSLRERLEDRFRYLLIDEYQDTNHAQYMIARGLSLGHENICATGDPDQSIYGWRGADIRNILEFEHDFPAAKVIRLEQNYRSTPNILAVADRLIKNNRQRKDKTLWTEQSDGAKVRTIACEDADDEADFLADEIQQYQRTGRPLSDIAIFYRVNSLTRVVEEAFIRRGISYQIARGTEFYNRREIKDLLAYLRLLINPADQQALIRAINTPARGIGKTTVDRLLQLAAERQQPLGVVIDHLTDHTLLKAAAIKKVQTFAELMQQLRQLLHEPAEVVVEQTFKLSGLEEALRHEGTEGLEAVDNVAELISAAADFTQNNPEGDFADWLHQISLVSDVDGVHDGTGAVTLMTLHAAKGLEFPIVFVIGLEDGLLPHERYLERPEQLEEERRLCFVGITRARERLTLTLARWRTIRGLTQRTTRSQFLAEIPDQLLDHIERGGESLSEDSGYEKPSASRDDFRRWPVGLYVQHPTFGIGRLLWKQSSGQLTRAGVRFNAYGEKTLILEYAKMQPLEMDA